MREPMICPFCGKKFIPIYSRQMYCNDVHTRVCVTCGKEFELRRTKEAINQVACCRACSMAYRKANGTMSVVKQKIKNAAKKKSEEEKFKIKQKREATNLKRYGVKNVFQNEKVKEHSRQTLLDKYGVEYASQIECVKKKKKHSYQENYGVDSPLQSPEIMDKLRKTSMEKYSTDIPAKSKIVKEHMRETN